MYVELVAARLAATQMPVSEIGVAFGFPGQRGPFSVLAESNGPESEVAPQTVGGRIRVGAGRRSAGLF